MFKHILEDFEYFWPQKDVYREHLSGGVPRSHQEDGPSLATAGGSEELVAFLIKKLEWLRGVKFWGFL